MSVCRKSRAAMAAGVILVSGGCARHAAVAPPPAPEPITIRIRGASTLPPSGNEPLIVIDGVVADTAYYRRSGTSPVPDPDQIESIEIIKGPSAAARYGEPARNGVILIRTRAAADCPEQRGAAGSGRKER
jgi:TonB-dependent SusC/RagA subfamily outer membrane receptor